MNAKDLVKTIKYLEIYTNRKVNDVFAGNYKSSFRGQGLEVSDLRKYEDGDDARYIDWIITAKQNIPYVKKFQETRELTTVLMVDISDSMKFTTARKMKSDIVIETAACLLFSAFKNNDKLGAIIFADQLYSYIPPRKGKKHLLHILHEIIQGLDTYKKKETKLQVAFDFLNKTLKKSSICFLLSDSISGLLNEENKGLMSLKIANKKHDFVYVRIFDNFEKKIDTKYPDLKVIDPETGETKVIKLSNKNLISNYNKIRFNKESIEKKTLKKNKIDFLSISTTSNIYKELLLFFKKRALKY